MQSRPVAVVGAGGHALVVVEVFLSMGVEVVGCWSADGSGNGHLVSLGVGVHPMESLQAALRGVDAFVAIGDNRARQRVTCALPAGTRVTRAISPHAAVSPTARIGPGVLVMPGAVINAAAVIGAGVIVNTGAAVDHECRIGDFAHLAPRSTLAGAVTVGEGAFVGIGAAVIPGRAIGSWAVVGAGAAVVAGVPEQATVVGVPARAHPAL